MAALHGGQPIGQEAEIILDVEKGSSYQLPRKPVSHQIPEESLATVTWRDLSVAVKDVKGNTKTILKGISGFVEPRQLLAIMGSSGSGKTTLLDSMAGRLPKDVTMTGSVLVNGHPARLAYGGAAYVTQDECLLGTLSVQETLKYVALIRLPQSMSTESKMELVDDIIEELGLVEAKHTPVGNWAIRGLSGGQRRRLAIGCEMVLRPALIFLDEPTSGLDSASAFYVMSMVQRLCHQGRTIAAVIHQPSSEVFEMFDQLCLLTDGRITYFGKAGGAADFFALAGLPVPPNRGAADHFLHCINRDFAGTDDVDKQIEMLQSAFAASPAGAHNATLDFIVPGPVYDTGLHPPPWILQTMHLTRRSFLNMMRDVGIFWLRAGMYIMLCVMLGFVYFQLKHSWQSTYARAALFFFVVAFLTFMSIAAFPAFVEDMRIFVRERLNGYYGVSSFVVANTLSSAPFIFIIALISATACYFLAALNHSGDRFVYFVINLFMSLVVVESLMMAIAPLVPHYLMGIAAGGGVLGMYMLCEGFFQPLSLLPKPVLTYPIHYIAYHSYAFNGLMNNEFQGTDGWACPCSIQPGGCADPSCTLTGSEVVASYDLIQRNKWIEIAVLFGMVIVYRSIFFVTLKAQEAMRR